MGRLSVVDPRVKPLGPCAVDSDDARESVAPYRLGPGAVDSDDGREAIAPYALDSDGGWGENVGSVYSLRPGQRWRWGMSARAWRISRLLGLLEMTGKTAVATRRKSLFFLAGLHTP